MSRSNLFNSFRDPEPDKGTETSNNRVFASLFLRRKSFYDLRRLPSFGFECFAMYWIFCPKSMQSYSHIEKYCEKTSNLKAYTKGNKGPEQKHVS